MFGNGYDSYGRNPFGTVTRTNNGPDPFGTSIVNRNAGMQYPAAYNQSQYVPAQPKLSKKERKMMNKQYNRESRARSGMSVVTSTVGSATAAYGVHKDKFSARQAGNFLMKTSIASSMLLDSETLLEWEMKNGDRIRLYRKR